MDLSHKSIVLYHASIERIDAAHRAFDARDYVLTCYLSGVAIECILQAHAAKSGAQHDARHNLGLWLAKCPRALQDSLKGAAAEHWNLLVALWDNEIRYYSQDALIGYFREKKVTRRISGVPLSQIREISRRLRDSARIIHEQGLKLWS